MIEWSSATIKDFQTTLLTWYDEHGRDLPWRQDQEPYHIWVSEIMLQQTQVQTVIPYYERFMDWFPTVAALAEAPEERLLKAWEGLGYYSRVRNMQRCARQIMADYDGQWPTTAAALSELVGIGPYTAGAIASIAFNEPVPAVDGNAYRVFSRLLEIDDDIAKPQTRQVFEDVISKIISPTRPGDFNQAIMDLGSSYMTARQPDSEHSPVKRFNQAYLDGKELDYPVKTKKPRPKPVAYVAVLAKMADQWLMTQRPSTGMLANLWTVPLLRLEDLPLEDWTIATPLEIEAAVSAYFKQEYQLELTAASLPVRPVTHTFTHQKWTIQLLQGTLEPGDLAFFAGKTVTDTELATLPQPKVQAKIWDRYHAR
ncbi:A/G-specific adenine glycosylase [Lactiplantibacillus fabifermentans]|uniref:Adenine DNA glycosylase n=2 Tax=Lactiplantibacillus fabifermentans TaxID=483011 RepID=A0A0R2NMM4_9LACO|nr:A/G-specific adenine glycosylase [Lactiplantibacillus fabifermentans]ETY73006.1 DNA glycosylase [Lactiplantibacillus fabifermentans T30PCM01]KRO26604.1 A G-specific adenine glycosylase [Lactiplantibacillus fabifermentans DSM 21115]